MQLERPATRLTATILAASVVGCSMGGAKYAAMEARGAYAPPPSPAAMAVSDPALAASSPGEEPKKKPAGETWKRSTIIPNSSRVMVGDKEQLALRGMQTKVTIDGFRARVVIDYVYANELDRQLEGTFQIRLPDDASPFFFAFGETAFAARETSVAKMQIATSGDDDPRQLMVQRASSWQAPKEARMVPRDTAQIAYDQTVRQRVDPALVEWAGAGVFSARVFPLAPQKLHRIVFGYDVDLVKIGDDLEYRFDLPEGVPASTIDLALPAGVKATTTPGVTATTAAGRQLYHFEGTRDQTIALRIPTSGAPLLVGADPAGTFFATQATPAIPHDAKSGSDTALFLVDTSLSSNPDRFNVWLELMRGVLDNNRGSLKRFNVVFFSVDAHQYRSLWVDNTAENVDALLTYANGLALEGATDIGAVLGEIGKVVGKDQVDVFLLSDGAATWGESNLHALGKTLRASNAPLFAYQTGLAGTDVAALAHLTRESGGAVFSVTGASEVAAASTAHRARPWRIVDVKLAGASDVMLAGRPLALFPGQTVVAVGRGAITRGAELEVVLEQGSRRHVARTRLADPLSSQLAARTYGQVATTRLEDLEAATTKVATAYATHFRITGRTSSLLMLETEADYQRYGIRPEADQRTIEATPAAALFDKEMARVYETLGDPKARFLAHIARLAEHPSVHLRPGKSYIAFLDKLPSTAFGVASAPIPAQLHDKKSLSAETLAMLAKHDLDYDAITADASARRGRSSAADVLKALSSLVEHSPGDAVLARDVGYSALDLGLRGQAFHLFRRVADARPHEPQTYRAMAQTLAAMGQPELAVAYYEIPLAGQWESRFGELRKIVVLEYVRLLRQLTAKDSELGAYARTRVKELAPEVGIDRADVVVTITWNTDSTDVDLHVVEPSGEECFYSHRRTRSGGELTQDVTQGYGPEMYVLPNAPKGNYNVFAHYFASNRNRASVRTKVYVTLIENWGTPNERVTERVISLADATERHPIATLTRAPSSIAR